MTNDNSEKNNAASASKNYISHPNQYSCRRKEWGETLQETCFHKSALFNQKKSLVLASSQGKCHGIP